MSQLTDYEKARLERIAKNQELLASLQIDAPKRTVARDYTPEIKPKTKKAAPRPRAKARSNLIDDDGNPVIARATRSNAARTAALVMKDPEAAKRKREEDERLELEAMEEKKRAKHGTREIEAWNPTGKYIIPQAVIHLKRHLEGLATSGTWPRRLHHTIQAEGLSIKADPDTPQREAGRPTPRSKRRVKKEEEDAVDNNANGYINGESHRESVSVERLRKTMAAMTMRATKRITPDRVYSLVAHPTTHKDLVFIGDRKGWLGMWDASQDVADIDKEDDDGDEDEDGNPIDKNAFVQRVFNDHGTISCMRLDPVKAHTIYTSSYDCTIRSLNFETGVWREEVDIDLFAADQEGEGEALASAFELSHDGNLIWVSDNRGGVLHADLREDKMKGKRWKLSESKIGCISVNPANQHYFVTSQLNREIRLWDARMVSRLESVTDYDTAFEQACVANYDTGRACSSTYFDPSGKHMLSTSYDDAIRVWNLDPRDLSTEGLGGFQPDVTVEHDNDSGAYVSVFKATWSSNPDVDPFFTVGNMGRRKKDHKGVDIYTKDGKPIRSLIDTANVPAVTCTHSTHPVIFGGGAGGRVYYWRADDWS